MDKQNVEEGEGEVSIEASGDAIVIADAIHALAGAIGQLAKAMSEEGEVAQEAEFYLDGSRK